MAGSKPIPNTATYDGERWATLSDGTKIQIDPEDAAQHILGKLRYVLDTKRRGGPFVRAFPCIDGKKRTHTLHREILGIPADSDRQVEFASGDRMDFRRENLRVVPHAFRGNKYECPVSRGRLEQLYWQEQKNQEQIAVILSEIAGHSISQAKVSQWMESFGIPVRARSVLSRRVVQRPEVKKAMQGALRRKWKEIKAGEREAPPQNQADAAAERMRRVQPKGAKAAAKKKHEEAALHLECDLCGKAFERLRTYVERAKRKGTHGIYCSKHCGSRASALRRSIQRAWEEGQQDQTPDWITDTLREVRERNAGELPDWLPACGGAEARESGETQKNTR